MNKKFKIILTIVAIALLLGATGVSSYYIYNNNKVVTTIYMDINPSIEIRLNKHEKVVKVIALNDDGKVILDDNDYHGEPFIDAVEDISKSLVKEKYITEKNNVVLINVDDDSLKEDIKNDITKAFKENKVEVNIKLQDVNEKLKETAEKYDISINKASYIEEIISKDSELKFEELKDKTINEINEIVDNKLADEKRIAEEKIKEAEEQAKKLAEEAKKKAEETKKKVVDNKPRKGSDAYCEKVVSHFTNEQATSAAHALLGLTYDGFARYDFQTIASQYNGICAYETKFIYNKTFYTFYHSIVDGSLVHRSETSWLAGTFEDVKEIMTNYFINNYGATADQVLVRSCSGTVNESDKSVTVEFNGLSYNFSVDQKSGNVTLKGTE